MMIAISGSSGCGKSTILSKFYDDDRLYFIPTLTDRPRRKSEDPMYVFTTQEQFIAAINSESFAEFAVVHNGCHYGTLKKDIENVPAGKIAIKAVDVLGTDILRKKLKDLVTVYITVSSVDILRSRLINRGETPENIEIRLNRWELENESRHKYNYIINNDADVDNAVIKLRCLIDYYYSHQEFMPLATQYIRDMNYEVVDKYISQFRAKIPVNPIDVAIVENTKYIIDGHHRYLAAKATNSHLSQKIISITHINSVSEQDWLEQIKFYAAQAETQTDLLKINRRVIS